MHNFNKGDIVQGSYYGTFFEGRIISRKVPQFDTTYYYIELTKFETINGYKMKRILFKVNPQLKYNHNYIELISK